MDPREERFHRLYEAGRGRVVAYALRRTLNTEDAADVVAETFAIAWRRMESIPGGAREIPWLYTVARRVIANRVRRTTSHSAVVRQLAHEMASASVSEDGDPERLAALCVLEQLSEDDREILMLVAWDGLSSRELGWTLSCTPTAARIRLHRARARLTEAWADHSVRPPSEDDLLQEAPER